MKPSERIELSSPDYEAGALPLSYKGLRAVCRSRTGHRLLTKEVPRQLGLHGMSKRAEDGNRTRAVQIGSLAPGQRGQPPHESTRPGSNRRHPAWEADALPSELLVHQVLILYQFLPI